MPITYDVKIESIDNEMHDNKPDFSQKPGLSDQFRITWTNLSTQTQNSFEKSSSNISEEEVTKLWLQRQHQAAIGNKLFRFLDGERRYVQRALDSNFLLAGRVNLARRVSDWGEKKALTPENRPLKLLFMACSALDVEPKLDFEKEEEIIFQVTERLAVDMKVEDSGPLEGLAAKLEAEYYDIVQTGQHA